MIPNPFESPSINLIERPTTTVTTTTVVTPPIIKRPDVYEEKQIDSSEDIKVLKDEPKENTSNKSVKVIGGIGLLAALYFIFK